MIAPGTGSLPRSPGHPAAAMEGRHPQRGARCPGSMRGPRPVARYTKRASLDQAREAPVNGLRQRQLALEPQPAAVARGGLQPALVRACDRGGDHEPQAQTLVVRRR